MHTTLRSIWNGAGRKHGLNGLTAGIGFGFAMLVACSAANAALVTGPSDPAYTTAFQGASAQTFGSSGYSIGTGANDLKVYTNVWSDPAGLTFGTLVNAAAITPYTNPGQVTDKLNYAEQAGGSVATNANARDYFFNVTFGGSYSPNPANDTPWLGNILDLGGQANKAVVFAIGDHPPYPQEALEYTIYMTNNPNSTNLSDWTLAVLDSIYLEGWESDSIALADAFTTVWKVPGGATFQYVSFQPLGSQAFGYGTPGGPAGGGDAEIDAIAGLTADNQPVTPVSEPSTAALAALACLGLFGLRRNEPRISAPGACAP